MEGQEFKTQLHSHQASNPSSGPMAKEGPKAQTRVLDLCPVLSCSGPVEKEKPYGLVRPHLAAGLALAAPVAFTVCHLAPNFFTRDRGSTEEGLPNTPVLIL